MKRMTEKRLRKIGKALGWREVHVVNLSGGEGAAWALPDRRGYVREKASPAILADEIAAGWAKAGVTMEFGSFGNGEDGEPIALSAYIKVAGFTAFRESKRLSTAILAVACEWADAGCPGGKA